MARGWESKSVEEQQAEAASRSSKPRPLLSPSELAKKREITGLQLSRQRVLQELQTTQHLKRREALTQALADLDKQIAKLA